MRASRRSSTREPLLTAPATWADVLGKKFGRLVAVGYTGKITKHQQKMLTCRCACGFYVDVMPSSLRSGATQSCGCLHTLHTAVRNAENAKHGAAVGGTITSLYRVWSQVKQRCYNQQHAAYPNYGGRGIKMFGAWRRSYLEFERYIIETIGERAGRQYSIDRIDNARGYVPGNLRWATGAQQARNKRTAQYYELNGERHTLAEWAELAGLTYDRVRQRVNTYSWSLDEALGTPPGYGRCPPDQRKKWNGRPASAERP